MIKLNELYIYLYFSGRKTVLRNTFRETNLEYLTSVSDDFIGGWLLLPVPDGISKDVRDVRDL